MRDELSNILEYLVGLEGVLGGIVSSYTGDLLGNRMPDFYSDATQTHLCFTLANTFQSVKDLGIDTTEWCYSYDDVKIILHDVDGGFLIVMCLGNVNIPMLNLSTNLVRKKVSRLVSSMDASSIEPSGARLNPASTEGLFAAHTNAQADTSFSAPVEVDSGNHINSLIPLNLIKIFEADLYTLVGPSAAAFVEASISTLGGKNKQLERQKAPEFVDLLSENIVDQHDRMEFLKNAYLKIETLMLID